MTLPSKVRILAAICFCAGVTLKAQAKKLPPITSDTLKGYVQSHAAAEYPRVSIEMFWEGPEQKQVPGWQLISSDLSVDEAVRALKRAKPGNFHGGEWMKIVTVTPDQMAMLAKNLADVIEVPYTRAPDRAWTVSLVDLSGPAQLAFAETKATSQELDNFLKQASENIRGTNSTAAEQFWPSRTKNK